MLSKFVVSNNFLFKIVFVNYVFIENKGVKYLLQILF